MYWLNSHGLQELEVISPGNGLTTAIQTDAVEYYHDSGVVSEYSVILVQLGDLVLVSVLLKIKDW